MVQITKIFLSKFIHLFLGRSISGQVSMTVHVGVHDAANKDWAGLGAAEDELSDAPWRREDAARIRGRGPVSCVSSVAGKADN